MKISELKPSSFPFPTFQLVRMFNDQENWPLQARVRKPARKEHLPVSGLFAG